MNEPFTLRIDKSGSDVHRLPLEEAERMHAEWLKRCPGSALECWENGKHKERERWVLDGIPIEAALNVARAFVGTTRSRKSKAEPVGAKSLKSLDHYLEQLRLALKELPNYEPLSRDWKAAQSRAYFYRSQALRVAKEEGRVLTLEKIPGAGRKGAKGHVEA